MTSKLASFVSLAVSFYLLMKDSSPPVMSAVSASVAAVPDVGIQAPPTDKPTAVFDYGDVPVPSEPLRPEAVESTPPVVTDEVAVNVVTPTATAASQPSAFADIQPETSPKEAAAPSPEVALVNPGMAVQNVLKATVPQTDTWLQNIVTVTNGAWSGTAVAVAPDTLVSAHHVVKQANVTVTDAAGTTWQGTAAYPDKADDFDRDGAIITVKGGKFPTMLVRAPRYYEPVTIYGLRTKTKQRGLVASGRFVALVPGQPGVEQGDSGGAVVADDGALVGIISGNEGETATAPRNPLVVTMTRMNYLLSYIPRASRMQEDPVGPVQVRNIAGDVDGKPSEVANVNPATTPSTTPPSAFDPPTEKPKSKTTAPVCTPQRTQQPVQWYYNTGPQYRTRSWRR